MCVNKITYNAR